MKNNEACVYYLDVTAFKSAMAKLSSNQFVINDYSETSFVGTIETDTENACIQTTIPYDKGWKVYVDGAPVEIYKTFDALVAFDIQTAGEHTVKMTYMPKELTIGALISVISIAAFATLCVIERKKKSKIPAENFAE